MTRRLVLAMFLALAVLAVGPAAVSGAASAPSATLAPTTVTHLRPVSSSGNLLPGYSIGAHHAHAHCSAGSEATRNAYRCFAGNHVYDPCWVQHTTSLVVCLAAPWDFTVVQLKVKHYDNAGRTTKPAKLPWGVQSINGVQCTLAQGASSTVAGKRVNYFCSHVKYVLYGHVNDSSRVWSIRKAKPTGGGHYKKAGRVKLTRAWFGKASRKG
jgi:hypothetical protein